MHYLFISFMALVSLNAFAVSVKIDFIDSSKTESIHLNKEVELELNKIEYVQFGDPLHQIEIFTTEQMPKELTEKIHKDAVLVDLKVFEMRKGGNILVSSGRVVTKWSHEASLVKYADNTQTKKIMTLKVMPKK